MIQWTERQEYIQVCNFALNNCKWLISTLTTDHIDNQSLVEHLAQLIQLLAQCQQEASRDGEEGKCRTSCSSSSIILPWGRSISVVPGGFCITSWGRTIRMRRGWHQIRVACVGGGDGTVCGRARHIQPGIESFHIPACKRTSIRYKAHYHTVTRTKWQIYYYLHTIYLTLHCK